MVFVSNSIEETQQLAMRLAKIIFPGTVIALVGELGTGKTTFTKGFAIQMGIKDHVTSPTFKLVSEYEGESWDDWISGKFQNWMASGVNSITAISSPIVRSLW